MSVSRTMLEASKGGCRHMPVHASICRQMPIRRWLTRTHQARKPYFGLLSSTSGSHVAISGNTVISAMHSTIMQKNGIEAYAT